MAGIPKDSKSLLEQLKLINKSSGNAHNRQYKLEIQRQTVECRLMEVEDYTFNEEGLRQMVGDIIIPMKNVIEFFEVYKKMLNIKFCIYYSHIKLYLIHRFSFCQPP